MILESEGCNMEWPNYGVVELKPENKTVLDTILNGFHELEPSDINQHIGTVAMSYDKDLFKECGMCVGAWASLFGDYPDEEEWTWDFREGEAILTHVFQFDSSVTLEELLEKHGAPHDPFGEWEWDISPYDVLRRAAIERFHYFHNIAWPVSEQAVPRTEIYIG